MCQQAYELQNAVAKLRFQRGERLIGYKVGCTSSAIQEQLKITHRVRGFLFDTEQYESGVTLALESFTNLAIEGELAIELSREPREEDFHWSFATALHLSEYSRSSSYITM